MARKKKSRVSRRSLGREGHPKRLGSNPSEMARFARQFDAWAAGKKVTVTIPNPNKNETNRQFIRVSGDDYFGLNARQLKEKLRDS